MAEGRVSRLNAFCVKDATGAILARGKVTSAYVEDESTDAY